MNKAPCKGKTCKEEVIWADLPNGGKVCLDPTAAVYMLTLNGVAVRAASYYVNHFATCCDANQFTKKKPEQGDLLG